MPTYEFACSCGQTKETVSSQVLENVVLPTCICGRRMRRVFTPPAIILKGGGFYSTDKNK